MLFIPSLLVYNTLVLHISTLLLLLSWTFKKWAFEQILVGSLFQILGAITEKALSPFSKKWNEEKEKEDNKLSEEGSLAEKI